MRHVIIDDKRYVRHIDAARDDIRGDQHIYLAVPEIQHDLVSFVLLKVGMHGARVYFECPQGTCEVFDTLFFAGEDDDFLALGRVYRAEQQLYASGYIDVSDEATDMRPSMIDAADSPQSFSSRAHI